MKRTTSNNNETKKERIINVPVGLIESGLLYGSYLCASIAIGAMSRNIKMNNVVKGIGVSTIVSVIGIPVMIAASVLKNKTIPVYLTKLGNTIKFRRETFEESCERVEKEIAIKHGMNVPEDNRSWKPTELEIEEVAKRNLAKFDIKPTFVKPKRINDTRCKKLLTNNNYVDFKETTKGLEKEIHDSNHDNIKEAFDEMCTRINNELYKTSDNTDNDAEMYERQRQGLELHSDDELY